MCTAFAGLWAIAGFFAGAVFELALAGLFKGLLGCPNSHAPNGPEEALEEISCKLIWEAVSLSAMLWLLSTASANMIFGCEFSSAIAFAGWLGWEGSFTVEPSAGWGVFLVSLFSGLLALPAWTPWPSMALKTCMTARFVFSPFLRLAFSFWAKPCILSIYLWLCFSLHLSNMDMLRQKWALHQAWIFSANQHDIKHDIFMQAISGSGGKSCTLHSGKKPLAIATSFSTLVPFAGMFPWATSSSSSAAIFVCFFEPKLHRTLDNDIYISLSIHI